MAPAAVPKADAAANEGAPKQPATNKQRVLKMMTSDDVCAASTEEGEAATLEHFVKKIRKCFDEKKFYS